MQFDLKSWNHHIFFLPGKIQYIGESTPLRLACRRHRLLYCQINFVLFRYYRKRASASYLVREVRSVRERHTERERERDRRKWRHHCRAEIGDEFCTFPCQILHLSIGEEFCTFPCQNLHLRFSPLEWHWVHTFRCQKRCTLRNSSHSSHCQIEWQGIEAAKQTIRLHRSSSHRKIEKMNQINT